VKVNEYWRSLLQYAEDLKALDALLPGFVELDTTKKEKYFYGPHSRVSAIVEGMLEGTTADEAVAQYESMFAKGYFDRLFRVEEGDDFDTASIEKEEFQHYLFVILGFDEVEHSVLAFYQQKFSQLYE